MKIISITWLLHFLSTTIAASAYYPPKMPSVKRWNRIAIDASGLDHTPVSINETRVFGEQLGPARASRAMAIVHISMFDAMNAIVGGFEGYAYNFPAEYGTSADAAIAQAAHDCLVTLFPSQKPTFDELLEEDLKNITGSQRDLGVALGKSTAAAILLERTGDGSNHTEPRLGVDFNTSTQPCSWQKDPISQLNIALGARWMEVTPFAMDNATQFRLGPPPELNSYSYTEAYMDVYRLGGDGINTPTDRSEEETFIGLFWAYDGRPSLCAPPRLYNQVAMQIATNQAENDVNLLRLLTLVNVAMADSGIAAWDSKYHYQFARPVTCIREDDGNPYTPTDMTFMPLGAPASNSDDRPNFSPPFPAYPSGHATFGGALFQTLREFYGRDDLSFTFLSDEFNGVTRDNQGNIRPSRPRSFASLTEAETENARSRIYLGVHWAFDDSSGIDMGRKVATHVYNNAFRPLKTSPSPTSRMPTSRMPTSQKPTSRKPTSRKPTSQKPTSRKPTSQKPTSQPTPLTTPIPPTTGTLGDWEQCSSNSQCMNGCCSGMYSGGVLKCTPLSGGFNPNVCTQTSTPSATITVQAESYSNMQGVVPEITSDVGGGQNVGFIDTDDWMSYPAVTIPSTGVYTVAYRVASLSGGGSLQFEKAGGTPVYGRLSIPATGGWQNWQTISHTVNLDAGSQFFGIKATSGGWNLNWFSITPAATITVQAESYLNMQGVVPEITSDVGGGQNVGFIDTDDWMSYPAVTIPSTGVYTVAYRVASLSGGGSLQFEKAGGTPVYGRLSIPATGGWQNWQTISHTVNLDAGSQFFGIKATSGGWNLNWFSITPAATITVQAESYLNMQGVVPEITSDVGGGQNVGNIHTDDWMSYPAVTIPSTGVYTVAYRVASLSGGGSLQFEKAGGTPVYGRLSIPATGGWQNWQTISHTVNLDAGSQFFGIKATSGGWNLNWFSITKA